MDIYSLKFLEKITVLDPNNWKRFKNSGAYSRYLKTLRNIKKKKIHCSLSSSTKFNKVHIDPIPTYSHRNLDDNNNSASTEMVGEKQLLINTDAVTGHSTHTYSIQNVNNTTEHDHVVKLQDLSQNLKKWASVHNINHIALKDMLLLLRNHFPLCDGLPKDPRTIMETPTKVCVTSFDNGGQYWHYGIERSLVENLTILVEQHSCELPKTIYININIDGLPIYKSAKYEFWPILFNIYELILIKPMVAGIYCGMGKPSSTDKLLVPFCNEMKVILENGIEIKQGHNIEVRIRCFICDSPARAFVKGVANFNAQHGCLKCTCIGEYSYVTHCNTFPNFDMPRRTDASFRARLDEEHHKSTSPVEQLPVNMVEDFPVADVLHLIHVGVLKRKLSGYKNGSFKNFKIKWSAKDISNISAYLTNCKLPKEIHRKVRGLDCMEFWKASEFATFLHYLTIVIFKVFLPDYVNQHFLKLYCAITICSSNTYKCYIEVAGLLLKDYVEEYVDIYGEAYVTSNVHNICHLLDDVKRFGILPTFSTYPFENKLFQIKRLLRTGNNPLQQVAKRMQEFCGSMAVTNNKYTSYPILGKEISAKHITSIPQCQKLFLKVELKPALMLQIDPANKWILTKDDKIIEIQYITLNGNGVALYGAAVKNLESLFSTPIDSSFLNIYSSNNLQHKERRQFYFIQDIKCKLVVLTYKEKVIFIPLLHTLDLCI